MEDRNLRISAYLDGALSPEEAARLEAEAAASPDFAAELEAARAVDAELKGAFDALLEAPLPPALAAVVSGSTAPGTRVEDAGPTVAAAAPVSDAPAGPPEVSEAEPGEPGTAAMETPEEARPDADAREVPPAGAGLRDEPRQAAFEPANTNRRPIFSASFAAMLALLLVGAGGGALITRAIAPNEELADGHATRGWMAEIADYHRVYARQSRHLAEVPASETAHIETWLGNETGVPFTVPDLAASGFTFQGARLLVAGGKPVAQLLYTDAEGRVLALCALELAGAEPGDFEARSFGVDIEMVRWNGPGSAWVAVGTPGMPLETVARAAAEEV